MWAPITIAEHGGAALPPVLQQLDKEAAAIAAAAVN